MDNSLDILPPIPDDPLKLLRKIAARQTELIERAEEILKKCKIENYGKEDMDWEVVLKEGKFGDGDGEIQEKQISEELTQEVKVLQTDLFNLNTEYLLKGVGEAMDYEDKKKNEESAFLKVFKMILSIMMFVGLAQYAFYGDKAPPKPQKKDMRFMTEDSRR